MEVGFECSCECVMQNGLSALMIAAKDGKQECVSILISNGAKVALVDEVYAWT